VALFVPIILMPFFLLEALGIGPSGAGMLLSVMPLVMAVVASPSGWLSDRIGTFVLAVAGMIVLTLGMLGLALGGSAPGAAPGAVGLWLGLIGLGTGIFITPNSSALMGSAPKTQQGTAGGVMALARTLGMMVGVAGGTAVFQAMGGRTGNAWRATDHRALRVALLVAAGISLVGAIASALRRTQLQARR
jgi:MFS family permease